MRALLPEGKDPEFQEGLRITDGEVVDRIVKRRIEAVKGLLHRVIEDRPFRGNRAVILVALQETGDEIDLAQRVRHAPRGALLNLQAAAKKCNAHISHDREVCRSALKLRIIVRNWRIQGGLRENTARHVVEECGVDVRHREGEMRLESLLEGFEARVLVGVLSGLDLRIEIGMAPQRPCANTIRLRERIFAPSTVMLTGEI